MIKSKKKVSFVVLVMITFAGFTFTSVTAQSSNNQSTSPKIYFDSFEALTGHRFVIAQQSGEMLAQIYNAKEKKIEQDLIRSGRGPFELEFMGGIAFNRQTKKLYAADLQNGKIICFDDQGNPLKEKHLRIIFPQKMDAFRDELLATSIAVIGKGMPNKNKYPIAYVIDPNTLEVSDTLFFDLDKLNLDRIKDLNKPRTFHITPLVVSSFRKGFYLAVFESFNKIFLIYENSEVIDEIEVNINDVETPEVVNNPSFGYGQRDYRIMIDYVRKGDAGYFLFSRSTEGTYNGLIEVEVSDTKKLSARKYTIQTKLEPIDDFHSIRITSDDNTIYGADGIDIFPLIFD